ncbi:hypothetical protein C7M61_003804 [Candidozyma pseudohaemuli]|uniref:Phytanoyl-CoA dioxygenase domain-containing protein 1 n=1 Tax=Candidozyma pseudohaemuli TaxID=418784 RepID=A0A2P7YLW0_9ASCO|nr:hypothetical protein C7M61_003804 [[Candida] pseudohaemulonii]PSK36939.1 hypothetical protein C7M61_003804 [[Candida] pseudohaemulonii]
MALTQEQIETFHREGMLCIPDFLSQEQIAKLMGRSRELLTGFDPSQHPKTQFKTGDNDHVGDEYFFDSADKVLYFFDTDAFDKEGNLKYSKELAINKIGHGLHMKDKTFEEITFDRKVQEVARDLDFKDPRVLQSMMIFKNPVSASSSSRENAVPPHTDATFLFTKPQTALGFWFALEDCTKENGCLSYNPGTHKTVPLTKRFVKIDQGAKGCNFIPVEHGEASQEDKEEDYKLVECKAGSLILINHSVLHKSEKNHLDKSRYAYAFHVIDGTAEYDNLNWLQVPPSPQGGTEFSKLYEPPVAA